MKARSGRRGNALVLVAALLVLMVLMATVFLTRARGIRTSAKAARQVAERDRLVESAARSVASEIAGSLFTRPIDYDPNDPLLGDARTRPVEEARRLPPSPDATRHDVDTTFAWNYAPSETVAWTNPPDWLTWPLRPGRLREMVRDQGYTLEPEVWSWPTVTGPDGLPYSLFAGGDWTAADIDSSNIILSPQENPLGGPGVSDTRWLRDLEPQRSASRPLGSQQNMFNDPTQLPDTPTTALPQRQADVPTHWRHLSFPGTSWNGWKMCTDIADVTGARTSRYSDGAPGNGAWVDGYTYYGGLLDRLDLPVEQWPAMMPTYRESGFGGTTDYRLSGYATDNPNIANNLEPIDSDLGGTAMSPGNPTTPLYPDDTRLSLADGNWANSHWDFWDRWQNWFTPLGYREATRLAEQGSGMLLPPNLYDLSDINGNGIHHEFGEQADDEYDPGTLRHLVSRVLADSDGDGNTDAFWFLSPEIGADGTRQLVAMSVTDNSGRLNVNAGTRGFGSDSVEGGGTRWDFEGTRGLTPADLALVGQNYAPFGPNDDVIAPIGQPTWNIGFFDADHHQDALQRGLQTNDGWPAVHSVWADYNQQLAPYYGESERFGWHSERWQEPSNWTSNLLGALGIRDHMAFPDGSWGSDGPPDVNDRENRTFYYQTGVSQPGSPQGVFTPFTLSDEFELRAYESQNMPWLYSRLERAVGGMSTEWNSYENILRGNIERTESSEDGEQLTLRQLGADLRHRLTTISGARNDLLAPHLRADQRISVPPLWMFSDHSSAGDGQDIVDLSTEDRLLLLDGLVDQMRTKIDLREAPTTTQTVGMSAVAPYRRLDLHDRLIRRSTDDDFYWRRRPGRVGHGLMLGLTGGSPSAIDERSTLGVLNGNRTGDRSSLYGPGDQAWEKTRLTAAAMAANLRRQMEPGLPEGPYPAGRSGDVTAQGPFSTLPGIRPSGAVSLPFFPLGYIPDTDTALTLSTDLDDDGQGDNLADMFQWADGGYTARVAMQRATGAFSAFPPNDASTMGAVRVDLDGDGILDPGLDGPYYEHVAAADIVKDSWDPRITVLPAEPQPVIGEVFVAHVARPWRIPGEPNNDVNTVGYTDSNDWTMLTAYVDDDDDVFERTKAAVYGGTTLPLEDYMPPVRPRTVLAVQLLNPFDVPIVLVEGGLPRYRLRVVTGDRFNPTSGAMAQFDLLPSAGTVTVDPMRRKYVLRPGSSMSSGGSNPEVPDTWVLPPSTGDKPYALTIVMNGVDGMPGFDENFAPPSPFNGEPAWTPSPDAGQSGYRTLEAERWLDFLDVHNATSTHGPANQAAGDVVTFRADPDHDGFATDQQMEINQGDLTWHLMPPNGWPAGLPGDTPSQDQIDLPDTPANWWAAHPHSDGTFSSSGPAGLSGGGNNDYDRSSTEDTEGSIFDRLRLEDPNLDASQARIPTLPERGSGVELVRLHYPDQWTMAWGDEEPSNEPVFDAIGGDGVPDDTNLDGRINALDAVPVTVDRTVGADGYDELLMVLTDQMHAERLPRPQNFMPPTAIIAGQGGGGTNKTKLLTGTVTDGPPAAATSSETHSPYYPALLWGIDADFSNPGSPTGEERSQRPQRFEAGKKTSLLRSAGDLDHHVVHPHFARIVQWARWARPWGVDDHVVDYDGQEVWEPTEQDMQALLADPEDFASSARGGIARPDRAGPRFVMGEGHVTKSSTRDGLLRYKVQGVVSAEEANLYNYIPPMDQDQTVDGQAARALHRAVSTFSLGEPPSGTAGPYASMRHDMPLLDSNRGLANPIGTVGALNARYGTVPTSVAQFVTPAGSVPGTVVQQVQKVRMRRYAEQSMLYPRDFWGDAQNRNWAEWYVAMDWDEGTDDEPYPVTNSNRTIRSLAIDSPQMDRNLPHNPIAVYGRWEEALPFMPPTIPGGQWDDWGLVFFDGSNVVGSNPDDMEEVGTTYHDSLGWLHHNIFDARWDPDGGGRTDANGDGSVGTGAPYAAGDNAYPYPWMTRMTREDWEFRGNKTNPPDKLDHLEPGVEYVAFRSRKPHALGFGAVPQGRGTWSDNITSKIVRSDYGWDFNNQTGYNYPWSFPDKGVYGFNEIDGEVLMPSGFQMPSQKPRNFERTGEVLDVFAAGTQLWMDIQGGVGQTPWPAMADWPPQPASPHTADYQRPPSTLRTLPEWLAEDYAAGRQPGRLDPFSVDATGATGGTAIIGGTRSSKTYSSAATDNDAPDVPDWYADSTDAAHFTPDLPATHQLIDMFVCDGPGTWDLGYDSDDDGLVDIFNGPDGVVDARLSLQPSSFEEVTGQDASLSNAGRFNGGRTSGLVNINTAPVEVLRALPQMYRLIHAGPDWSSGGASGGVLDQSSQLPTDEARPMSRHPRSGIPEAIVQYRDGLGGAVERVNDYPLQIRMERTPGTPAGPVYADRGIGHKTVGVEEPFDGELVVKRDLDAWYEDELGLDDVHADAAIQWSRGNRGFASTGELLNLQRPALYDFAIRLGLDDDDEPIQIDQREWPGSSLAADAWRMDWAARNPFGFQTEQTDGIIDPFNPPANSPFGDYARGVYYENIGAPLTTDSGRLWDFRGFNDNGGPFERELSRHDLLYGTQVGSSPYTDPLSPIASEAIQSSDPRYREIILTGDRTAGDAEEANLLFSGISNMITTRSDVFTVHLRVRTIRRNPDTGIWDGTDRDSIVDDSRYVMVVDRSEVNSPDQTAKILLLEKVDD